MHPDHVGLAPKLLERTGARLLMHPRETEILREIARSHLHTGFEKQVLEDAGVPAEMASEMEASFVAIRMTFRELHPDTFLSGGERLATAIGNLEVIHTRGHSPGHLCLYNADHRLLLSGDQILEHITPNIGFQSDHDALGEFLSSLDRLAALDADLILPSHGSPFRGHRAWVEQTKKHHGERCAQIEAALAAEPKTAHELVGDLWNRKLSAFHHRFAAFEVLAHLEYLKQRGRLEARRDGQALRWSVNG
jgi:glyoxylase-like metal-dependent hydrolase (beta-lactamase superfamily II)